MTRFWIIRAIWWAIFGVGLWFYWQPTITVLVVLYGVRADVEDAITRIKELQMENADALLKMMQRAQQDRK